MQVVKEPEWRAIGSIDKGLLREARLQAHYAVQWLARFGRGYIPPQPDDGHTSLIWDHTIDGFRTHPLKNGLRLSLQMDNLTLALTKGEPNDAQSILLSGRTDSEIRKWLGDQLSSLTLNASNLDAPSPYQIPTHAIARGASYNLIASATALAALAAWFANAEILLSRFQRQLISRDLPAGSVCCWPHHFDIAFLTTLTKQAPDSTGYVGMGLSPGDEHYDEPYFYVSIYPKPDPSTLPPLPALGLWHTHEFTAAVAPAHKIALATNPKPEIDEFLQRAVDIALKLLT